MARQLAAEGSTNRSTLAQLFAGFLAQTAAILAAWQRGKRFRFSLEDPDMHMPHNCCVTAPGPGASGAAAAAVPGKLWFLHFMLCRAAHCMARCRFLSVHLRSIGKNLTVCRLQQAAAGHVGRALVKWRMGQAVHRRRGGALRPIQYPFADPPWMEQASWPRGCCAPAPSSTQSDGCAIGGRDSLTTCAVNPPLPQDPFDACDNLGRTIMC